MDELNSLSYLDAVVREILRVHAPVRQTGRCTTKDDVIPLSIPIMDRYGQVHNQIKYVLYPASTVNSSVLRSWCSRVDKGTDILIPIQYINLSKTIWGDDAAEFK